MYHLKLKINNLRNNFFIKKQSEKVSKQAGKSSLSLSVLSLLFKIIILGGIGTIVLFPFFYMISGSLMTYAEISDKQDIHLWPDKLQWSNYTAAFQAGYWDAMWLTFIVTLLSIVAKIFITLMMGYAFAFSKWKGKNLLWYFLLSLLMLPEVAILSGQFKMVTDLKMRDGSMLIAALAFPFVASVFSALMFKNAFSAIPLRTKEAAMVDGAGGLTYFFRVAVPMVTPTIWTVGILTAFAAWNSYMWPSLLLNDGSGTQVMSTWQFTIGKDPDPAQTRLLTQVRLAGAVLAILPMFIVYFAMRRRIMKAISRQGSAIKG
ncbi:carbohydrate ABC transporter permease [Candidatus Mycoplasma mahonii]|uniref:carbohydrate ABC transporter permease n=1 Tax=Candidatus Mycoplasma mahonii TaxID=3004105 RepID=UPI0026F28292|nr:carbohydrate ABC transporter permease [Candidatus Mycoplasma mahonii]WKX02470.1 carbohydrate ABC transporter permease [Candidatus Mycoplasma mahonii]